MKTLDQIILNLLPTPNSSGAWMPTPEIVRQLEEWGEQNIYAKKVLRSLKNLEDEMLVLSRNKDGRELEWQRKADATGISRGAMSMEEALALQILKSYSTRQLPELAYNSLKGLFDMAATRLKNRSDPRAGRYDNWMRRIAVVGGTFQLVCPEINDKIFISITNALLNERLLKIGYRKPGAADKLKHYTLMPLGLVESAEGLLYLWAKIFQGEDDIARSFRLDRMVSAKVCEDGFSYPPDFDLTSHIKKERAMEFFEGKPVAITLRVFDPFPSLLQETPISEDQQITHHGDGCMTIRATVVPSFRFRQWLLSQGADIEVVSPKKLRDEIVRKLDAMRGRYGAAG